MKKIKIGLFGGTGKMGFEFQRLIANSQEFELAFSVGRDLSNAWESAKKVDFCIDFSVGGTVDAVRFCVKRKTPLISGATGLTESEFDQLKKAGRSIPVLWSANMSLGIAALRRAIQQLGILSEYHFSMEEWHHRHKKDQPSGTAKALASAMKQVIGSDVEIHSVRAGGIFGMHTLSVIGDSEYLQFTHQALNRGVFAEGALKVVPWLIKQNNGFYSLEDYLDGFDLSKKNKSTKKRRK